MLTGLRFKTLLDSPPKPSPTPSIIFVITPSSDPRDGACTINERQAVMKARSFLLPSASCLPFSLRASVSRHIQIALESYFDGGCGRRCPTQSINQTV